ncbi:MAG: phage major tail tube protein [Pseudomonadota bacterium]
MFPRTIRNFNAWLDGVSYFGKVKTGTMPELALATQSFRGGGMDAPIDIDMGQEAMTAELVFAEHAPELLGKWGTVQRIVLRAAAQGETDFEADQLTFTLGGRITRQAPAQFGAGSDVDLTLAMNVRTYRIEHGSNVKVDIDIEAGKRLIDGVDQIASTRAALGIGV